MIQKQLRPQNFTWRSSYFAWSLATLITVSGCMSPMFRSQSPEFSTEAEVASSSTLVSHVAHPYGLGYIKVEAVSMATGLAGTGEDPAPSPQRSTLMEEMMRREVDNPKAVLASPNTALVIVRGFLRPGAQKGDRFDIEVRTSSRSETTSLRGGHLLETRLSEMAILGEQLRKGHVMAMANGAVLVDPTANSEDESALATRGRILGGGVVTKSRSLGLILDHDRQSVRLCTKIGKAINTRFHTYIDGLGHVEIGECFSSIESNFKIFGTQTLDEHFGRFVATDGFQTQRGRCRGNGVEQLRGEKLQTVLTLG